jgi:hypothetical protein
MDRRLPLLGLLALLATAWVAWQIYAGWGLVTLDVRNQPVAKVLASISRQGGIDIASNVAPATLVTLKVKRVPPVEALDIVAVRTEASWRLAYLGAPDEKSIAAALAAFRSGSEAAGWSSYGGGGFTVIEPQSGAALDLRRVKWTPGASGNLHDLLKDAAQKTGVLLTAVADWNPSAAPPAAEAIAEAAPRLFRQAGGVSREVFLLRARPRGEEEDTGRGRGGPWIGRSPDADEGSGGGWRRAAGDPQSTAERVEAQIALLPESERAKAREDSQMMRDFWQSVRELPEEQRRAKAQEFFNRPEVAERMDQRRLARESKMTPQQRIERAQRYLERKAQMKKEGQQ